ncbi:hypothetical protein Sar04_33580 [Salinispora arenicola]|uniref:PEP-CTERM sorting domain-containing protein n=1 Tax=Salinispora arenicola TaxID=168697 RepID=A0ABQ4JUI1_SALAC|nr:hypothetical protein Sar04_33580 [Salinispora arenicola]
MPGLQPDFPDQPVSDYNYDGDSGTTDTASLGELRVIVPPDAPEFGPAATLVLLRLLVAVHRQRKEISNNPTEET